MRWLVRLVTPAGGIFLDPFAGSGSTGCATVLEGCRFIGIEKAVDYARIARARVRYWSRVAVRQERARWKIA
jgi:site-specific DNA-methyltransferase (adenine-specific)